MLIKFTKLAVALAVTSMVPSIGIKLPELTAEAQQADCGATLGRDHRNVRIFSNGDRTGSGVPCRQRRTTYGLAYQCVEYVRRFYIEELNFQLGKRNAIDYYRDARDLGLVRYENGGNVAPAVDDIIVFKDPNNINPNGHVGIISEVTSSGVTIYEQNWGRRASNDMNIVVANGRYTLNRPGSQYDILGWVRPPTGPIAPKTIVLTGRVENTNTANGTVSDYFPNGVSLGDDFEARVTYLTGLPDNNPLTPNYAVYGQFVGEGTPLVREIELTVNGSTYEFTNSQLNSNSNYLQLVNDIDGCNNSQVECDQFTLQVIPVPSGGRELSFSLFARDSSGRMLNSVAFPPDIDDDIRPFGLELMFTGRSPDGTFVLLTGDVSRVIE